MTTPESMVGVEALDVDTRDRFVMVYEDVWQVLKGTTHLSVYMALKRRTTPDMRQWFGTRKGLAEESGVSPNTFDRSVGHLVGMGLVVVVHRFVPKGWKGDPAAVSTVKDAGHPVQIGNLYRVRYHLPAGVVPPTQKWGGGVPKSGETPYPDLGTRYITPRDITQGGGDGSSDEAREGATTPLPLEPSSDASSPADAGTTTPSLEDLARVHAQATPDTWCAADDPRCRDHAQLSRDEVPACRQCGNVRAWFEERERAVVDARRQAVEGCGFCDDRGLVEVEDSQGRPVAALCGHQGPPQPVSGPVPHREVSSASTRRRALEVARGRRSA